MTTQNDRKVQWKGIIVVIALGLLFLACISIAMFFPEEPKEEEPMFIESSNWSFHLEQNLSSIPQGIIFYADYITFDDGNLNLTFDDGLLWNFEEVDYIEFNIANKTYTYNKTK